MTRRRSREHGREVTTDRPAADYTTRTYDTSGPMRSCGLCGCQYRDTAASRRAHQTVFGHQPTTPEDRTATAESAPEDSEKNYRPSRSSGGAVERAPADSGARASGDASTTPSYCEDN